MMLKKLLAASALFMMPLIVTPAAAQDPGNDPVMECIIGCVASRPNSEGWCVQECNRRFGNEQRPNPGTPALPCNPYRPFGCSTRPD